MRAATHLLKAKLIITPDINGLGPLFYRSIAGLKQGCNLNPLLANKYFSDLHEHLEKDFKYAPTLHEKSMTSITCVEGLLISFPNMMAYKNVSIRQTLDTQKWGLEVFLKEARCVIFSKGYTNLEYVCVCRFRRIHTVFEFIVP